MIELKNKQILTLSLSRERNTLVAGRFPSFIVRDCGKHPVFTYGGYYPQACRFLKLNDHIHPSYEKSVIERIIHYIKDRTESFDDYFSPLDKIAEAQQHNIAGHTRGKVVVDMGAAKAGTHE